MTDYTEKPWSERPELPREQGLWPLYDEKKEEK